MTVEFVHCQCRPIFQSNWSNSRICRWMTSKQPLTDDGDGDPGYYQQKTVAA